MQIAYMQIAYSTLYCPRLQDSTVPATFSKIVHFARKYDVQEGSGYARLMKLQYVLIML